MESQQSDKEILYVFAGNANEFMQYTQTQPDFQCIMLSDGNVLRGRCKGKIIRIGTYMDRWNYPAIEESIERAQQTWDLDQHKESLNDDDSEPENFSYGI